MPQPPTALRRYVTAVQSWLRGESPLTDLPQRVAAHPVPGYVAALASHAVELGGELADGIMPFMWPAARVTQSKTWAARGRAKAPGRDPLAIALGLPTFLGDDLEAVRAAARQNLGFYTTFPFLQRLFRVSGFAAEAAQMEQGAGSAALTDRLLDATCLLGPVARCREQLTTFRAAGVDLPILGAPGGIEEVRRVIQAFRR
jgi:alkanesulfonate monooxygenase SsuD/methylene tetrahydromethanopterin reductase-like flavin-dependent oxidoreductase (luciferase family)